MATDLKELAELKLKGLSKPTTWHWTFLQWQEGVLATGAICGLVLFELLYVSGLDDSGGASDRF